VSSNRRGVPLSRVGSRRISDRNDLTGALQGYYATEVLLQLLQCGVLARLGQAASAAELAESLGLHADLLAALLDFLSRTTDIVKRDKRARYRTDVRKIPEIVFQIEKFAGAYGPAVRRLGDTLASGGHAVIDERALSRAFANVGADRVMREIAKQTGLKCLLDLGCGSAQLLIELAIEDPEFRGIGFDTSHEMCRMARKRSRLAQVDSRIRIYRGDGRTFGSLLSERTLRSIDAVHGRSFLNSLFRNGTGEAVAVLRELGKHLPGRTAWFIDYYGELGRSQHPLEECRLALLQDVAQIASGQGVPPTDAKDWMRIYDDAECMFSDAVQIQNPGIRTFIHQVQFPSGKLSHPRS
jgi:SAM-dependent methyltransferase